MTVRLALLLILAGVPGLASGPEVLGTVGYLRPFLDETGAAAYGAAVRVPIVRRLAVRPELLFSSRRWYSDLLVAGSLTFDVTDPDRSAVLYIAGGGGITHSTEKLISYSYSRRSLLGGIGMRFTIGRQWSAASELRLGETAFPAITFHIGYRFPKSQ